MNCGRLVAMTFSLKEQLDSRKECKIIRDLCLIESEDSRPIVVVDPYFPDSPRSNVPGLLPRHCVRENLSGRLRDAELQDILEIVLNCVPAGCPCRQTQIKTCLIYVLDDSRNMKLLCGRIIKTDRVVDLKCAFLRLRGW